jgi:hypothetical protein
MRLPNGEHAEVPLFRLTSYLLNPAHPVGKHKARVFASALALHRESADDLRDWLRALAVNGDAQLGLLDKNGQRFVISGQMRYKGREAMVRTAWIVRPGRQAPEFLTAFVE